MTISTQANSQVFLGNNATLTFNFSFIADSPSVIAVIYTNAAGLSTTLNPAQYTLVINPPLTGQLWGIGGSVTYPLSGPPIAPGTNLTIMRKLPLQQLVSLENQGNLLPQTIEEMGDTLEMQIQQVSAQANLAITIPVQEAGTVTTILPPKATRALQSLIFDASGNVTTGLPSGNAYISTALQPFVASSSLANAFHLLVDPFAPHSPQIHQNGGGTNNGDNLCWADQNSDIQADHYALYTYDQTLIFNYIIGGSITGGDILGFDFTLNSIAYPVRYTVQNADTTTTIATALGEAIAGDSALTAALLAFTGPDGYGYESRGQSGGANVLFNFPWGASNNVAPYLSGGATETITINNPTMAFPYGNLDNGGYFGIGRYVANRPPQVGDLLGVYFFNGQSGPNTNIDSTLGAMGIRVVGTSPLMTELYLGGAQQSGSAPLNYTAALRLNKGIYGCSGTGSGNPCIGGDMGFGTSNVDGPIYQQGINIRAVYGDGAVASVNVAGNTTLSAAALGSYGILRSGAAAIIDTTATASQIVAAINIANIGTIWRCLIINTNSGTMTITPGVGVTLIGNLSGGDFQISAATTREFIIRLSSVAPGTETVAIYG